MGSKLRSRDPGVSSCSNSGREEGGGAREAVAMLRRAPGLVHVEGQQDSWRLGVR